MTLSIITINYNNLEGLRKTIDSVISQTWHDFEWIIIDGGSTDGSKELIEDTANKLASSDFNPLSYWCSEPDKGIYNAMNKGIKHCNGEYINFMNSGDSFYEKKTLSCTFRERHNSDIIYGKSVIINKKENYIAIPPQHIDLHSIYMCGLCHQAMFIKIECLMYKGFEEKYKICADYSKWLELVLQNVSFEYIDLVICRYDDTGVSSTNIEKRRQERLAIQMEKLPFAVIQLIKNYDQLQPYNNYIRLIIDILRGKGCSYFLLKATLKIIMIKERLKRYIL